MSYCIRYDKELFFFYWTKLTAYSKQAAFPTGTEGVLPEFVRSRWSKPYRKIE